MRTETIEIFTFDELTDDAKARAREWWRSAESADMDLSRTIDDAVEAAKILGIEISTRTVKLYGGGTRQEPKIWWRGFWSQGDGACFEGYYSYAKGAARRIRAFAPTDTELHAIADDLQRVQRGAFYRLAASVSVPHRGPYCHEYCTRIDVEDSADSYRDLPDGAEDSVSEALRDFIRWIYRRLESDYEFALSDKNVEECIRDNGYEFDEYGDHV